MWLVQGCEPLITDVRQWSMRVCNDQWLRRLAYTLSGVAMGRRTYDHVRGFAAWPYTGLDCRVVTSRPLLDAPDGVMPVASPTDAVAGWADRRVWLLGGTTLPDGFRTAGLVREY